jgi:hypothetical protein
MTELRLAAHYGRETEVDHCRSCGGLWFDRLESQHLTAGGTLTLLEHIAEVAASSAIHVQPRCVRCRGKLREVTDMQRGTRFTYHACPSGHGRFITPYQFLREKHLVRELSAQEVLELRAAIQQINCVNCGGPVRLSGASVCPHCATPVSTIDPGQLRRELASLRQREAERGTVDPTLPVRLAHERAKAERAWADAGEGLTWLQDALRHDTADGLLASALRMLSRRVR